MYKGSSGSLFLRGAGSTDNCKGGSFSPLLLCLTEAKVSLDDFLVALRAAGELLYYFLLSACFDSRLELAPDDLSYSFFISSILLDRLYWMTNFMRATFRCSSMIRIFFLLSLYSFT